MDFWADYEIEIDEVFAAPDGRVVSLVTQRGKGRTSGLAMEMEMAQVATLRSGKITRFDNHEDRAEALEDVGLQRAE